MKRVKYVLPVAVLTALCLLTLFPRTARADEFAITWTGVFGPGSVTVDATNEGGGEFLITSLTGTQGGSSVTLLPTNTYGRNTNLIFPSGSPLGPCAVGVSSSAELDNCGFAFTDGTSLFDIFTPIVADLGTYWECDSSSVTSPPNCLNTTGLPPPPGVELTSFIITPVITPEPATGLLLLTSLVGLSGVRPRPKPWH